MKRRAAAQSALFAVARNCLRDRGWHGNLAPGTAYLAQDFLRLASCVVLSKDRLSSLVRIGDAKPSLPSPLPWIPSRLSFPSNTPSRSAMVHVNSYLSDRFGNLDMELYCRAERIKSRCRSGETLMTKDWGWNRYELVLNGPPGFESCKQLHRNLEGNISCISSSANSPSKDSRSLIFKEKLLQT